MATRHYRCERYHDGTAVLDDVALTSVDGRLARVAPGSTAPADAVRLAGLVLPGFANAHAHAFHRALRGRTWGSGTFWSWRDAMYEVAGALTPDTYRALATAVFAELVCAGYTEVGEFHYLHHDVDGTPYGDRNAMTHALVDAATVAGIRLTVLDACYLASAPSAPPEGVQRRFSDPTAEAWASRVDALGDLPPTVTVGAAVHSVRAVDPGGIGTVAGWAAARGAVLHAHVSEQPAENEASLAAYGASPTAVLDEAGALSSRFTAVHATHVGDDDRARLRRAAATVCVCPTTEEDLADGLCDLGALASDEPAGGLSLALGSDSHAVVDPFTEARALEGHERLRTGRRGTLAPAALLGALTTGGRRSLGTDTARHCDLVAVSLGSARLAGADDADLLGAVLAAATADDVDTVVVGGEVVVSGGAHHALEVPRLLDDAIRAAWR